MSACDSAGPVYAVQPITSSRLVGVKALTGLSRRPCGTSSTTNAVPACHRLDAAHRRSPAELPPGRPSAPPSRVPRCWRQTHGSEQEIRGHEPGLARLRHRARRPQNAQNKVLTYDPNSSLCEPSPCQPQDVGIWLAVDQYQVGLDVTVTVASPFTAQVMIRDAEALMAGHPPGPSIGAPSRRHVSPGADPLPRACSRA